LCGLACWSGRTEPLHRRYCETGAVSAKMTIPAAEFGVSAMIAHIRGYTECKSARASDCDRRVVAGADRRGHRNLLSWGRSIRQAHRQTTVPMIPCLRLLLPLQRSAGSEQRRGYGNHCFLGTWENAYPATSVPTLTFGTQFDSIDLRAGAACLGQDGLCGLNRPGFVGGSRS
jgi:hypothetical protein